MGSAHYARLGTQECENIHAGALEALARIGVEVHDEEAREFLVKGGAEAEGLVVRIPSFMVEKALLTAPRGFVLHDRNGKVAMRATSYNTYYGAGSDCLNVLDHRTGERRRATLQDSIDAQKVIDALPEIDFSMSMFLPSDVDQRIYDRYQMQIMLNNTTKPIVFVSPDFEGCVAAVEMAEAVAGGADALRHRPFVACYVNVTSSLVANAEALQKCMYLAQKGIPQLYIPLGNGGVHAPCSPASATALMMAGTLLGVVLSQLVRAGAPIGTPGWSGGYYNMQSMVGSYCLPDEQGLTLSMGHYYGLPTFGLGGSTDSKALDQQAGAEMALGLAFETLEGANILHDIGFMDAGLQGSLQLMAIANEFIGWIRHATQGVEVTDEALALDVAEEVGPSGSFIAHEHTIAHFREGFYPKLVDRNNYTRWVELGGTSMEDRAARMVDQILETHHVEPLPADVQRDIAKIVEREERWAASLESR